MARGSGIVAWIARLHPLVALIIVIGSFLLGRIAGIAVAFLIELDVFAPTSPLAVVAGTPVPVLVVIGYPVAVAIHVLRTHGAVTGVRPARVAAALTVMIPAFVIAMNFFASLGPGATGSAITISVAILAWLAGVVYILWTASRGLVLAEQQGRAGSGRVIGTFVLFWFLPFGIYFLQRRVRRLAAGGLAAQAA